MSIRYFIDAGDGQPVDGEFLDEPYDALKKLRHVDSDKVRIIEWNMDAMTIRDISEQNAGHWWRWWGEDASNEAIASGKAAPGFAQRWFPDQVAEIEDRVNGAATQADSRNDERAAP